MIKAAPILQIRNLSKHFPMAEPGRIFRRTVLKAVNDISFDVQEGEVLSLVGESGCGKTTVGRAITKLDQATGGEILFNGQNIVPMKPSQFRPLRRQIQMIFQDPFASLNPRRTVEQTLAEPLFIHRLASNKKQARTMIKNILDQVGLDIDVMKRHPHEFSGGQRQRIGIARAMIVNPRLIIADEAVSALDVSIQAQVLNLLKTLQRNRQMTMLFISHDLGVVRHISDRIAVMHQGKIVEIGDKHQIFESPAHQYTQLLLASIPRIPSAASNLS